jgi:hypothetical protein
VRAFACGGALPAPSVTPGLITDPPAAPNARIESCSWLAGWLAGWYDAMQAAISVSAGTGR